jgi:hypothetical protein
VKQGPVDLEKLRVALRRLSRGDLLMVAERAIEVVPRAKLRKLIGDRLRLDDLTVGKRGTASLLAEVRKFHEAGLGGEYYEGFDVNSKNFMDKSEGTEAFIAEFDRLVGKCVRAGKTRSRSQVRQAFELLFELLRHVDEDADSIIFFADEAGAWQVGVDWRTVLPAYFGCLADEVGSEDFASAVHRSIADFDEHDRARHLASARRVANTEQKAALRRLPTPKRVG